MIGGNLDGADAPGDRAAETLLEVVYRSAPERQDDDLCRIHVRLEEMDDTANQELGLSRARPAHDELVALRVGHDRRPLCGTDSVLVTDLHDFQT